MNTLKITAAKRGLQVTCRRCRRVFATGLKESEAETAAKAFTDHVCASDKAKRHNVTLDDASWKALLDLGNGNASAGIRKALELSEPYGKTVKRVSKKGAEV